MLSQLRELAASRDYSRLEETWIEAIGEGVVDSQTLEGLIDVAESIQENDRSDAPLGTLLELLGSCVDDETPARLSLRLFSMLAREDPRNRQHREAFCDSFEKHYPMASPERAFYDAVQVRESSDLLGALTRLERLMLYREGAYVFHASGWGMGKVLGVDPFLKQVRVNLEEKPDHRIAVDAVDSILEFVPPQSFRALLYEGGDELARLRDEAPTELVDRVLDSFGNPLGAKEIRGHLVPNVIDAKTWARWWSKTRSVLRSSGFYRIGERSPYLVERLEAAVSYADELVAEYFAAQWPAARKIAKQAARRSGPDLKEVWSQIRSNLAERVQGEDVVVAIDAASILARAESDGDPKALHDIVSRLGVEKLAESLQRLPGPEAQRKAAAAIFDARPADWKEIARKLVAGDSDALRTVMLNALAQHAPETAAEVVDGLLASPNTSPRAVCFLLSSFVSGQKRPHNDIVGQRSKRELLVIAFDLIDHVSHRAVRVAKEQFKDFLTKIQSILDPDRSDLFVAGIELMSGQELRELHRRIVSQENFTPETKGALLEILAEHEPQLEQKAVPPWEEECIYTTAEGLERRRNEFREIMEVKLPKNFEDIGRAAGFGDLSENAEYTAALETRDQLTSQATRMKEELDKAVLIEATSQQNEVVSLGSVVSAVNLETGQELLYRVLGPWDGSPEEGVLAYSSPLARSLFGKRAGEQADVELPGGSLRIKIEGIRSFFE